LDHESVKYLREALADSFKTEPGPIDEEARALNFKRRVEEYSKLARPNGEKQLDDSTEITEGASKEDGSIHEEEDNFEGARKNAETRQSSLNHQPEVSNATTIDDTEQYAGQNEIEPKSARMDGLADEPSEQLGSNQEDLLAAEHVPLTGDHVALLGFWDLLHQEEEENGCFNEIIEGRPPTAQGRQVARRMIAKHKERLESGRKRQHLIITKENLAARSRLKGDRDLAWRRKYDGEVGRVDLGFEEEAVRKLHQMSPSERTAAIMEEFIDLGDGEW
jgi:hypothetical protein